MNRPGLRRARDLVTLIPTIIRGYFKVLELAGFVTVTSVRLVRDVLLARPAGSCPSCGSTSPYQYNEPCRAQMLRDRPADPYHPDKP
ncbi:MAG TPA: hypothetical protein VGK41_05545 [Solirubrobacterales bacterium]